MNNLAIISCHWNPASFRSLRKNWHTWRKSVTDLGVPVVSVELSYDDQFHTDSEIKLSADPSRCVLWQKEALLNIALRSLPADVDRFVWADADILFDDQDWLQKVDEALDEYPIVQCFREVRLLDKRGKIEGVYPGSVVSKDMEYFGRSKPGYIWAARREIFPDGFYPKYIGGGADVGFLLAGMGAFRSSWAKRQGVSLRRHWLLWSAGFYGQIRGRIGYVDATITHLYHGSQADRRYYERDRKLAELDYDPATDVEIMENGILQWTDAASQELIESSRQYFIDRREDE